MTKLLLVIIFAANNLLVFAQGSDILAVKKKNGRTIKNFYGGSRITMELKNGDYVNGPINKIKNDSLYVEIYDIRTVMTNMGVYIVDTFSHYMLPIDYKDIARIKVYDYYRFVRGKIGKILMYGGAGYFAINIINGVAYNESITSKSNVLSLAIAAAAFSLGVIINKFFPVDKFSRKRDEISYLRL